MVTKGYGSPPPLVLGQGNGSGWLTVRKHHLGLTGDTFIELVKLTKAVNCARMRVHVKHTHTHRWRDLGRGSLFLI